MCECRCWFIGIGGGIIMEVLERIYEKMIENHGETEAIRYIALVGGLTAMGLGIGLLSLYAIAKPQQPIIILN